MSNPTFEDFSHFKVAAIQAAPVYMNREETVEKACKLIEEAAKNGAKIIGFPECFIPGFPSWVYVASPIYETINFFKQYVEQSVEVPSKITDALCEVAKENEVYVVMGIAERDKMTPTKLYITQLFIGNKGEILGRHRKIVPTYAEKLLFTSGDGSTLSVFKTEYGELGGLNCGEHNNPLAKFALIAQNEKIHVASWPMPGAFLRPFQDMIISCVREYAYESKAFVINSSAIVTQEIRDILLDYAKGFRDIYEQDIRLGGGVGCIVGPFYGRIIAQADPNKEEIVYADCDISEHYKAKINHDILGNYNRPEIFNVTISKKEYRLVEFVGAVEDEIDRLIERLPIDKRKAIEKRAAEEGKTVHQAIMDLLEKYAAKGD